jgi:RNA polymerase sigma-70 factor (ECF subfamily)
VSPCDRWSDESADDALVAAARDGDRAALEHLLRRHHDRVLLLCRRICRDRQDAEDAAQHALIAIVKGLPRFDSSASFSTWSYRVTTNACLDELRRTARRPVPATFEEHQQPSGTSAAIAADPGDEAIRAEDRRSLQQALDRLPDEFRLPVVLRDVAQLDYAEIAERLGVPAGTVRSRISRGRARLAELLRESQIPDSGNQPGPADVGTREQP